MSLSNYPPGVTDADIDRHFGDDDDNDYADAEAAIEALDGQILYESSGDDIDADLDVFDSNRFSRYDASRPWSSLTEQEQALWNTYAEVRQGFAYLLLED